MSRIHELKTDYSMFAAVASGTKNYELRYNDRGFRVGDKLVLLEQDQHRQLTGTRSPLLTVNHILDETDYGLRPDYRILSFTRPEPEHHPHWYDAVDVCYFCGLSKVSARPFCAVAYRSPKTFFDVWKGQSDWVNELARARRFLLEKEMPGQMDLASKLSRQKRFKEAADIFRRLADCMEMVDSPFGRGTVEDRSSAD